MIRRSYALYLVRRTALMFWFACGGGLLSPGTWRRGRGEG